MHNIMMGSEYLYISYFPCLYAYVACLPSNVAYQLISHIDMERAILQNVKLRHRILGL